jgi:hypothetical protein
MKTARIVQAVTLMLVVALAASCAATKEYSSKLFSPRNENGKDSQATALRFLELDSLQSEKEGWVTTDIIMGRDTVSKTLALDKLAKIFPVVPVANDTVATSKDEKTTPVMVETKPIPAVETKPIPVADHPIAKNYDPTEVRNKKTREK